MEELRVWIDSQTEEEILRGIREAKDLSEYDNLSASAYLRAKEDYLMGINFSRLLTLKYGSSISSFMNTKYTYYSIDVTTKTGKEYNYVYCDYYIQDNTLTVFRETSFEKGYIGDKTQYYKFESHFTMDNVENLKCITK